MVSHSFPSESTRDLDTFLDTLGHPLRRETIRYFEHGCGPQVVSVDAFVDHIGDRVPSQSPRLLRMALVQKHFPKLAGRGWLEVDYHADEIRYRGNDAAEELVEEVSALF